MNRQRMSSHRHFVEEDGIKQCVHTDIKRSQRLKHWLLWDPTVSVWDVYSFVLVQRTPLSSIFAAFAGSIIQIFETHLQRHTVPDLQMSACRAVDQTLLMDPYTTAKPHIFGSSNVVKHAAITLIMSEALLSYLQKSSSMYKSLPLPSLPASSVCS